MAAVMPERLETERLVLRPFVDEDWKGMHEHYSDPICTRYTFGRALDAGESWRAMAGMVGHWSLRGYGPYAVEKRAGGELVGTVGLWYPNDWPAPEIKWALVRRHWRHGFAREAAWAVREAARRALPSLSLISFIDSANGASVRTAIANGGAFERVVPFRGGSWHIYRYRWPEAQDASRPVASPRASYRLRTATAADERSIADLIAESARHLASGYYSSEQIDAAIGAVWRPERELLDAGTFFVAESSDGVVGCGGWSPTAPFFAQRAVVFGAGYVRTFFVRPGWERRRIGATLLSRCEAEISARGLRTAALIATRPGEPLYRACGYVTIDRLQHRLPSGLTMEVVEMAKDLPPPAIE
jgi:RimJ/RimL family protein N-acetyltransferase/N-acetylglutamate synthase-like GNAT family acetyltransferase